MSHSHNSVLLALSSLVLLGRSEQRGRLQEEGFIFSLQSGKYFQRGSLTAFPEEFWALHLPLGLKGLARCGSAFLVWGFIGFPSEGRKLLVKATL